MMKKMMSVGIRKKTENIACDCDTFECMANRIGMKVLHPGGLMATEDLAEKCGIQKDVTILDVGCGRGSTSIFLARQYGCRVIGIDIDRRLLLEAQKETRRNNVLEKVSFRIADITNLPFEDESFDGAIVQAMLIFTEKSKALHQLIRKIKFNQFIGLLELTLKKPPPPQVITRVRNIICREVSNAEKHDGWINLLKRSGLTVENAEIRDIEFDFNGMLRNEGFFSTIRIVLRSILEKQTRNKMKDINNLFKEVKDYLGYGIYVAKRGYNDRSRTFHQNPRTLGNRNIREIFH
jgi:SAM-dependent methyltransferase